MKLQHTGRLERPAVTPPVSGAGEDAFPPRSARGAPPSVPAGADDEPWLDDPRVLGAVRRVVLADEVHRPDVLRHWLLTRDAYRAGCAARIPPCAVTCCSAQGVATSLNQPLTSTIRSVSTCDEKHTVPVSDTGVNTALAVSVNARKFRLDVDATPEHGVTVTNP